MRLAADIALSKEEIAAFLAPFISYVTATTASLQLNGDVSTKNPWLPKLHSRGVDISFTVTTPSLRKAILCWSWNKTTTWEDLVASVSEPAGLTLLWNKTYYRAFGLRLPLFLAALGALGQTKPRPAGTNPFNGVVPVWLGEKLKVAAQAAAIAAAKENAQAEGSDPEEVALAASDLQDMTLLKQAITDPELQKVLGMLGSTGVARLFAPDLPKLLRTDTYQPIDFVATAQQFAAKLSRGKYRGAAPAAAYTPIGLVVVSIPAPFPVLLACRRGSDTALAPLAVGVDLSAYVLAAPVAAGQALTMGVLALGLAAAQAQRGPAQAVQRGRIKLDLSPEESTEIRAVTAREP